MAGRACGVTVIDDFAHSPEKISASLELCRSFKKRIIAIYQPHGFTPTYKHRNGFLKVWKKYLSKKDFLLIPEIYYVGGTVPEIAKTISSLDLVEDARKNELQAYYFKSRKEILKFLLNYTKAGDMIIVMGARDDTLSSFCMEILRSLKIRCKNK